MDRYLLIGGWKGYEQKKQVTKEDLVSLKNGTLDYIIDTTEGLYFDVEQNKWEHILTE